MTRSLTRTARSGPFAWTAIGLAAGVQLVIGFLWFVLADQVDPLRDPLSDYVFHGAGQPLFELSVLLLLTAGGAVAMAAYQADLPSTVGVNVLFGLWAAGLVVVLMFRGNVSVTESTLDGEIHRFGGGVLFASLPLACRALARHLRTEPRWAALAARLRWCAFAGLGTAAAFGLAQFVRELPQGLLQRVALTAELVILVTTALAVRDVKR